MPSCEEVARRATDYLEGGLPWWRRLGFRLHLMMCDGCGKFVESIRTVSRLGSLLTTEEDAESAEAEVDRLLGPRL